MLKKILAIVAMLYAAAAFAAVDVNKATAAELDGIKGIGPGISTKILDERKKGNFKDWNDFIERVKGIGEANAAKFSAEGVTVGGASYKGAPAAPAAKLETAKPAAAAAPAATAAPAAAPAAKADPKAEAKMKAEEEKKAKAAAKAKAAEEKKAKKEADMKAKEEAKAKKAEKPAAKADAAKPAASAAKK
jgi:competence protein ComEA